MIFVQLYTLDFIISLINAHLYERSARRYNLNISKSSINIAEKIELVQEWSELQDLSSN